MPIHCSLNFRLPAVLTDRRRRKTADAAIRVRQPFKDECDFATRKAQAEFIRKRFPDAVPLIVEKLKKSRLNHIDQNKIAVPQSFTIGELFFVIAKHIQMRPTDTLFIMVDDALPSPDQTLGSLYADKHDEDMFLYVSYTEKNLSK